MNNERDNGPTQIATGAEKNVSKAELQERLSHYLLTSDFESKPLITQEKLDHELKNYAKTEDLWKRSFENFKFWIPTVLSIIAIITTLYVNSK